MLPIWRKNTKPKKDVYKRQGIDTVLTRGFDEKGTNLAGVKARQLAIARVFAENYDLIILMSRLYRLILSLSLIHIWQAE